MQLLRRYRVSTRLWSIFGVGLAGFALFGVFALFTAFGLLLDERQHGAEKVVSAAADVVAEQHERAQAGEITPEEAREQALAAVAAMGFDDPRAERRRAVWVADSEPRLLRHPGLAEHEGEAVGGVTDPDGLAVFDEAVDLARAEGSGYLDHLDLDAPEGEAAQQTAYVAYFEPWDWVLGTSVQTERGLVPVMGFAAHFMAPGLVIGALILVSVGLLSRSIVGPLGSMVAQIREMTGDSVDLTRKLPEDGRDEVAEVARSFNALTETSRQALAQAAKARDNLERATKTLSEATQRTSQGIERQSSETDEVATAMNEMVSTVQEVARNTSNAADSAQEAEQETSSGRQVVERTVEGIQDLADELERTKQAVEALSNESEEIRSIVGSINEITEQTNLLALNAAIEAARAGESGRGFAVVADEVRKLSARTQESTQRIQEIAERFQQGAKEAVERMGASNSKAQEMVSESSTAGDRLNAITRAVSHISELNTQIASAAEEQSSTAEEINRNVVNIRDVANETASGVREITQEAEHLQQLVEQLHTELARIRY